jgi:ribonuclease P protein component
MLKKKYRLKNSRRIQEVKREGRSWRSPWLVLIKHPNDRPVSRFAFVVSRRMGTAVIRKRFKRLLRESVRHLLPHIQTGWDVLLIVRWAAQCDAFEPIDRAAYDLLKRSGLLTRDHTCKGLSSQDAP